MSQEHSRAQHFRGSPARLESLSSETLLALAGGPGEWRQALLSLEAARASSPQSAAVWSDLSAVQYSLALEQGEPVDFLPALDAAEQAFLLDPRMPEALFNKALCLEALGLFRAAKATWNAYLEEDDSSGWADEALQHLQTLRIPAPADWPKARLGAAALAGDLAAVQEIVRGDRSPSRRLLEEEILRDWGVAALAGEPKQDEAAALLRAAGAIATAYEELTGDSLYREAVEAIKGAGSGRLAELAAAHRDFGAAVQAIDQEDQERAADLLDAALRLFGASPFAWRAELKRAIVEQRQDRYPAALERLSRLQEGIREASYRNLAGEAFWVEGMVHKFQDRLDDAAQSYGQALPFFEAAGETDLSAGIYDLQAELLDTVGQAGEVWRLLQKAFSAAPEIHLARRLYQIYSTAGISAWVAGYPRVGLLYWTELQPWAESNPQYPVDSRLWRARLLHDLGGEPADVQDLLAQARDRLAAVPADDIRRSLEAEIRAVEGEVMVTEDPAAAVASLNAALRFYVDKDKHVWDKGVHLQLGRAWRLLGHDVAARAAFAKSLDRTETQRSQLDEDERASLLRVDGEAFEQLIDLDFTVGDHRQALAWSEQQRARTLLDRFAGTARGEVAAVQSIAAIQQQLPPDLTLIEYASVRGRWLAWVISSQEVRGIDLQIGEDDLEPRVRRWVANIQREVREGELKEDAAELYRALILPLELPAGGDWIIVPDGVLKDLPFAALFDGKRFLIESHALATAPSANFFLQARQRNRTLSATQPLRALVLGNPAFDARKFPLGDLPDAAAEATAVGELYGVKPFLEGEATKARFLRRAPASEIVQFSGHAQTHPESPLDSALLLAGEVLAAEEIYRLRLHRTRLMVLSACSTASGPSQGGEGAESLARAFLAAGVPGVVATLWNVEDQPTSELVIEFHRRLRQEGDARRALQQAQVQFLDRPVASWAAFQLIGDASFDDSQP